MTYSYQIFSLWTHLLIFSGDNVITNFPILPVSVFFVQSVCFCKTQSNPLGDHLHK